MTNQLTPEKQKIINSLQNTFCRLKPSKASGVGVFAVKDIPANTKLFSENEDKKWYTFQVEELTHLSPGVKQMIEDFFVIEKDNSVRIPQGALNGMDMSYYVNHSQNPNTKTTDGGFTFVSTRKILVGEEITISYATYDLNYT